MSTDVCSSFSFCFGDAFPVAEQAALEAKYKEELDEAFGIKFNNLFTITNMPIKVSTKSNQERPVCSAVTATKYCHEYE